MPEQPPTKKEAITGWKKKTLAVCLSIVFALMMGEVVIRLIGEIDEDGNFFVRGNLIGQQHPHVKWVEKVNREYVDGTTKRMIYNSKTGWSPRPHANSHKGMYQYNSQGIRSAPSEFTEQPTIDIFRIALFGDSFTHGDDVSWDESWAAQLERILKIEGKTVEVLNFGVSAYGMDQAFLRWQSLGKNFKPHLVIVGFQPENIARNVNLLRGFYVEQTGIPFSKPRFVLDDNGFLKPINLPCLKPEEVSDVMANMSEWEFADKEFFYFPEKYHRKFWHFSRLISLLVNRTTNTNTEEKTKNIDYYNPRAEPAVISLKIVEEFRNEVEATGSKFFVIHLPRKQDIDHSFSGEELPYAAVLEILKKQFSFIEPLPTLLKHAQSKSIDDLFVSDKRHYSKEGNSIVANRIAEHLKLQRNRQ